MSLRGRDQAAGRRAITEVITSDRSHDGQATRFGRCRQSLVIRADPAKVATNRVRSGQVDGVLGSQVGGQHGPGSVEDTVIEPYDIDHGATRQILD